MGKKAFSPERIRCYGKKDNEMTESDDALLLRVAREEIKRQAAEIERLEHWQRAVDDACTVSWVPVTDDARETVKALIARECQIALDPLVSSDAQALIDRGRKEAEAEIERLKTRLEVSPDHPYDGIYCRDATIKLQDERIERLEKIDHELTGALNAIAAMKDHAYYQVRREQVAVDAHSIAYGALARAESHKTKRVGFKECQLAFLQSLSERLQTTSSETPTAAG